MSVDDGTGRRLRVGGWIPGGESPATPTPPDPHLPPAALTPPDPHLPPAEPTLPDRHLPSTRGRARRQAPTGPNPAEPAHDEISPGSDLAGAADGPTSPGPERAEGRSGPAAAQVGASRTATDPDDLAGAPRTVFADPDADAGGGRARLGRRRLASTGPGRRPLLLALLGGVAAFAIVVVVAVAWLTPSGVPGIGEPGLFTAGDGSGSAPAATDPAVDPSVTPSVGPSASPSPSPSASASAAAGFRAVAYEAEARGNTLLGQAEPVSMTGASGGTVVRNLGDGTGKRDGALRFNGVTVPAAGTYTLTFHYAQPAGPRAHQMVITVAGAAPLTVTVDAVDGCCASRSVRVKLRQGANSITFDNPNGPAPAVDRIVLSG